MMNRNGVHKLKYMILVISGLSDITSEQLSGQTPLEAANTPVMDSISTQGRIGLVETMAEDSGGGSDQAILSLLGYDPASYAIRRGALEAAGIGVNLEEDDLALRLNFVSTFNDRLVDHNAGQIGNANLTRVIDKFLEEVDVRWSALEGAASETELAREAHTLASTCRSFGLPSIGEKIACIEQHAKFGEGAGEPPCIAATGRELLQGAADLKAAMERYRVES